jgi:hypothetical protein
MNTIVIFGAVALDDPSTLRVADLRTVALPKITALIEVACAADVKLRSKAAFPDSDEGLSRFSNVVCSLTSEKKVSTLIAASGSDVMVARFAAVTTQCLARLVTRMADLPLKPGMVAAVAQPPLPKSPKSAQAAQAKVVPAVVVDAPLALWIGPTADLIFLILVESLMAFWQRPATMAAATKLSVENAEALLRCDVLLEDLAINAALIVLRRHGDFDLAHAAIASDIARLKAFSADLLAHLPPQVKAKVGQFDEGAAMALPAGAPFRERFADPQTRPLCVAQLGSWAAAVKVEKADFKKAVQQQVAALAAVPPPVVQRLVTAVVPARAPQALRYNYCLCCEKQGRNPNGHTRETCPDYKCYGCGAVAPGHTWRNCPDPRVGGPCPPHSK